MVNHWKRNVSLFDICIEQMFILKTGSWEIYVYFILAISHIANNICLFSRSIQPSTKRRAIYYIEVMELWTIISFTNVCTKKDISLQTHNNTTRYCETLMHHCLFDVFWLQGLCRLCIRYTMVRGHICMLQRNRDIYYYCYYYQYNTARLACNPNGNGMYFVNSLLKACYT